MLDQQPPNAADPAVTPGATSMPLAAGRDELAAAVVARLREQAEQIGGLEAERDRAARRATELEAERDAAVRERDELVTWLRVLQDAAAASILPPPEPKRPASRSDDPGRRPWYRRRIWWLRDRDA